MREPTTIYRVEDAAGTGPYWSRGPWEHPENMRELFYDWTRNPSPWNDGIDLVDHEHRFGFDSLGALRSWFPKEALAYLADLGHKVKAFKVEPQHIKRGGRQVAFVYDRATPVRELSFDEVFA